MKYRIVSRNKCPWSGDPKDYPFYYAQMKVFGMWIDCRYHPFKVAYSSYDTDLETVEWWVNKQITRSQPVTEKVVKTYD